MLAAPERPLDDCDNRLLEGSDPLRAVGTNFGEDLSAVMCLVKGCRGCVDGSDADKLGCAGFPLFVDPYDSGWGGCPDRLGRGIGVGGASTVRGGVEGLRWLSLFNSSCSECADEPFGDKMVSH